MEYKMSQQYKRFLPQKEKSYQIYKWKMKNRMIVIHLYSENTPNQQAENLI